MFNNKKMEEHCGRIVVMTVATLLVIEIDINRLCKATGSHTEKVAKVET